MQKSINKNEDSNSLSKPMLRLRKQFIYANEENIYANKGKLLTQKSDQVHLRR